MYTKGSHCTYGRVHYDDLIVELAKLTADSKWFGAFFHMSHDLGINVEISKSFNIDARIVGRVEEGTKSLTIRSEFGEFNY